MTAQRRQIERGERNRRRAQRIVDKDPRVVKARESLQAVRKVILDFQKRHADAAFVIEQLRDMHDELEATIRNVEASIFNPKVTR